jgi:hypothetical protein
MCVRAHVPTNTLTITTIPKTTKQPNKSSALNSHPKPWFVLAVLIFLPSTDRTSDSEQWVPLRGVGECTESDEGWERMERERERETRLPM